MCCHNENVNQTLINFPILYSLSILDYRCWSLLRPHLKSGYTYVFPLAWKSKVDGSSVNRKIALISKMRFLLVVWAKIVQMIGYTALKVTFIYVCKSSLSRKKVDIQPFWPFGQKKQKWMANKTLFLSVKTWIFVGITLSPFCEYFPFVVAWCDIFIESFT